MYLFLHPKTFITQLEAPFHSKKKLKSKMEFKQYRIQSAAVNSSLTIPPQSCKKFCPFLFLFSYQTTHAYVTRNTLLKITFVFVLMIVLCTFVEKCINIFFTFQVSLNKFLSEKLQYLVEIILM